MVLLQNEIEVGLPLEDAWAVLTDLGRIAPCMPGATLEGQDGDTYAGTVKIRVGPITASFRGTAAFVERDAVDHRAVIAATGKDPKGQSTATAEVRAWLEVIDSGRTRVLIDTDLDITGKVAQFGRGAIADVSSRLLGQFAANLATQLDTPAAAGINATPAPPAALSPHSEMHPRPAGTTTGSDLDAISLLVPMLKERYGQALLGGLLGLALSWALFGRRPRT